MQLYGFKQFRNSKHEVNKNISCDPSIYCNKLENVLFLICEFQPVNPSEILLHNKFIVGIILMNNGPPLVRRRYLKLQSEGHLFVV